MHLGIGHYNQPFTTVIHKKELILKELKKSGCRITYQRKLIVDVLLSNQCSSCKEIYYNVINKDPSIGVATVYRMVKKLEDIGAINRKKSFDFTYDPIGEIAEEQILLIDREHTRELEVDDWFHNLKQSLIKKGFINDHRISVIIKKA